ncbi:dTDP-4-dehydrorhamnose 3,5-epimerase [Alicyclobacillus dauci]|uniref:dTDP-4-dehydrorhamnose 3,5-epimerase n=1 Tax=Alicyclobacillus dauci TaxID=1475485 RepID=A0ABY6Z4B1_9BACL|nr:dTDP-4-dehydrorhamnose 3,5-epimerase [Alicyclobacillus dauci]WAH37696.1 dTDP-4-dehydrorhamnose 3,5-epimerase [Alicyclobacillus dauci]
MKFIELKLAGSYLIELEPIHDERGFFARSWCVNEFEAHSLHTRLVQCNVSYNKKRSTLRGMHYQASPHQEAKLVRCTRGALYDVIVDLRPNSSTFQQWIGIELTADNHRSLYVPEGFAHGFQTLVDDTEVFYQMTEFYSPESARGLRWDDPVFGICWPIDNPILSDRDKGYGLWSGLL